MKFKGVLFLSLSLLAAFFFSAATKAYSADTTSLDFFRTISPWSRTAPYVYLNTATDRVGLGTDTPSYKLDVQGGSNAAIYGNSGGGFNVPAIWGVNSSSGYGVFGQTSTGRGVYGFNNGGSGYGVFGESATNIGVYGVGGAYGVFGFSSGGNGVQANSASGFDFYGAGNKSYFNGFVGIGTTAPRQKLDVNGRIRMSNWTADGTTAVYKNANGDIGLQGSDIRLKKNITKIDNSLNILSAINGVKFNWIGESDQSPKTLGVVAQDVLPVLPEAVFTFNKDGQEYYGVHYEKLTALLIEAVKAQQKQITDLRSEIESLKAER